MKLRNKKTGEIVTLTLSTNGEDMIIMGNDMLAHTTKLSELKDYEDYEEPKEYWYIDYDGGILLGESDNSSAEKMMISIGNHFKSIEEAEKAVEKLKAVKRLKDKGFRFRNWYWDKNGMHGFINFSIKSANIDEKDINLLFGGEE